eukprot:NODE_3222_length_1394_cov_51.846577_g2801_i0.p1 GENE.NODE_3222_length_1394_cov_51.846577_g2801_i0~~NODE_3222_length_1394_cov_51.846577_g2801_i0.p1  ORF type:complete len:427 (+),score=88.81 NODE_3222_length_1394_cov_51.846577_g2801_i0:164-1282(+)
MLVKDPTKRITAKESLQHPWIQLDKDRFGRWSLPDLSNEKLEHPELYVKKFIAKRALIGACQAVVLVNYFIKIQRTLIQNKPPKIKLLNCTNSGPATNQQRLTCIAPGRVSRSPMRGAGQLCSACNRPVDVVEAVQVSLGTFHYSCFVCGACGGALRGSFAEVNGSPYHTECLPAPAPSTVDSDLCYVCGKSCFSGIKALSRTYHEKCFKCYICAALITEESNYEEEGGEPYHRSCLQKRKAQEPWRRPTSTSKSSGSRPTSQRNAYNTASPSNFEYSAAAASMKGYQPGMQPNYRPTPISDPPPNTSFDHTSPSSPNNTSSRRVSFEGDLQSLGTLNNDQSKFKSKFCQECGSRYSNPNARFCMECGAARV